ncbi:MAG: peptide chain release factor N(5)-glutamine methyltransferase [Anaerolineales bacterium]|nr:peptide chain release factor N(5)-glutamine methyltransferase [Anaerolineales bacterium]
MPQFSFRELLSPAAKRLEAAGSITPSLDAQLWLAHVCKLDRTVLLAHPERTVTPAQVQRFQEGIDRLAAGEPLPYLTGEAEFYGLSFSVTPGTLIPRPETEHLVDAALELIRKPRFADKDLPIVVADVGTGSGCITVSLAVHAPDIRLIAIDASSVALRTAISNVKRHKVQEQCFFLKGSLLMPLLLSWMETGFPKVDLIVANLPYIADHEWFDLPVSVRQYEPSIALKGGPKGLDLIEELLRQAPDVLAPGGAVLMEIGAAQGPAVVELARFKFPGAEVQLLQDYAGLDRLVIIQT